MSSRFSGGLPSAGGRSNRKTTAMSQPHALILESLPNQNIEISQVIRRDAATIEHGYTKVLLRGVPNFLIDAFDRILKEGKTMEGLFRKEGNAARMKNSQDVYNYKESVTTPDNNWTVHDVCSLVKRFLRDLKNPLIVPEIKKKLFEYAKKHPDGVIESHKLTILFESSFSDKGIVHTMPPEHIGTLGYIMRKLSELSKDASVHQMTVQNLATVFAPTIFREATNTHEPPKTPKATHGKTSLVLQRSVEENELRIAAMILLIKNSQWIGVPSNFYLSSDTESTSSTTSTAVAAESSSLSDAPSSSSQSSWSRSNSLRPTHSIYGSAALPTNNYSKAEKGGSVSGRKIEKRHSVKMAIANRGRHEEKDTKDRRRSNSTVRDIISKIGVIGERVRRRSGDRKSPSRLTSPPASSRGKWTRGRSPAKKLMLEVDEHTVSALAAPLGHYEELRSRVTAMTSSSSSSYEEVRCAVTTGRPSLDSSTFLQKLPAKSPNLQKRLTAASESVQSKQRPTRPPPPTPKTSATKIERVNSGEKKKTSPCESRESRRRVSAASAAVTTTQPLPRRSITSVRDEPNSILGEEFLNPNHKFPLNRVRRHTAPIKTGLALRRNQPNTVHSGLRGPARRATMTAADDKENARALIRVITRRREDGMEEDEWCDEEDDTLTDTNRTMTGGIAVVYSSETILEQNHMEARARRTKRRRSGGTESKTSLTPVSCALSSSMSNKSPAPPPLPLCSPPTSSVEKVGSGRRSSKRAVIGGEDVEMPVPPLSAPPIPCPRSSLGGGNSPHFAIPSLPVGRPSSVSSSVAFATPSTSRRPIGAAPPVVAVSSPLGRRGSSASALDSPQFKAPSSLATRRQMSMGENEFAFSESNRAAILEANDATELHLRTRVGTRPSVALLRNQNKGMVAARVNLFAAIQSTNDAENASMRSSLGSRQSLTGLDDSIVPKPSVRGGPPVGHSIMSNAGTSSGNNSNRSSIASHR